MAADALPEGSGTLLLIGDASGLVAQAARAKGWTPRVWNRWCVGPRPGTPWPEGTAAAAAIRLPKAKAALRLAMHAAASVVADGPVYVYGAKDEGIRSIPKVLSELFATVDTLAIKRHCRLLVAHTPGAIRGPLAAWAQTDVMPLPSGARDWVHYPGVFAKGGLDAGTALLLDALPAPAPRSHVLDFACGTGVIAAELRAREPSIKVDLLDADTIALAAAAQNVPGARRIASDAWHGLPQRQRYDLIVSNPPFHQGKSEDFTALTALIEEAAQRLAEGGALWLVVQRQLAIESLFHQAGLFNVRCAAQTGRFRVWSAQ
jgi:16S rRNA (guanine1207-N2)-methyltransferase